jgi:nicotinate-nucleotide adenylyltransferase
MKIALFGGSFDPPHTGHLLVAKTLIDQKYVDQVWFVPTSTHPFEKKTSPTAARLKLLQQIPDISIATYELEKPGNSYSVETLEHFAELHPEHTFSWVVGADQLKQFSKWYRYQDLLSKFQVFVYPRAGYESTPLLPGMTLLSDVELSGHSSTKIRQAVHQNQSISDMTTPPVAAEINKAQLYKE